MTLRIGCYNNNYQIGQHFLIYILLLALQSLVGHTTPIECVRFGQTEELVVAGSASGALKIWDLEAAKLLRTLTGHKSGVKCIDFHPYGDFLCSGSSDTSLRLWDTRRKGCIFSYKGHTSQINKVKFSPDGQWIARYRNKTNGSGHQLKV